MKYRLIATDMDGTLLNDKSEVSERTKAAVIKAVEAGVIFVTATGRPMCAVEGVNSFLSKDMPFIIFNGASAVMGKSREVLFNKPLDFALACELYSIGVGLRIPVVIWTGDRLWVSRDCEEIERYRGLSGAEVNLISDINELRNHDISKTLWIDKPERVSRLYSRMKEHFGPKLNCHPSSPRFLEFVNPLAGKAEALEELGRRYGIDSSEMIAVGDSYNDISMLCYAGLGVAMENAPDDIKAVCAHVTKSNNNDGVAAVIEKYCL